MADESIPNEGGSEGNNNEGSQNQSDKGTQGASEVDLSKITADDFAKLLNRDDIKGALMQSEDVRREIQSQKDKELARENRKRLEEDRARANAEQERLDAAEKQQLVDSGDLEGLGKREAARLEKAKQDSESASRVGRIIEDTLRKNSEFQSLGEDRINEIYTEVSRTGGTVVDFTTALSREKTKQAVDAATAAATDGLDDKIQDRVDAALAAAGVAKRSAEADGGDGPVASITDGTVNRANIKLDSEKDISLAYGAGDISTPEFKRRMKQFRDSEE